MQGFERVFRHLRGGIETLEWVEWRFSVCSGIKGINGVKVGKDLRVKISGFYRFEGGDSKLDGGDSKLMKNGSKMTLKTMILSDSMD